MQCKFERSEKNRFRSKKMCIPANLFINTFNACTFLNNDNLKKEGSIMHRDENNISRATGKCVYVLMCFYIQGAKEVLIKKYLFP